MSLIAALTGYAAPTPRTIQSASLTIVKRCAMTGASTGVPRRGRVNCVVSMGAFLACVASELVGLLQCQREPQAHNPEIGPPETDFRP